MNWLVGWFSDPGHAALSACLVSILSIGISVVAFVTSRRTQKKQLRIEEARERDRVSESRKAKLVARTAREQTFGEFSWHLYIENKGAGEARDIVVTVNGKPVGEHSAIHGSGKKGTVLGPGSSFRYPVMLALKEKPPSEVAITWSDDSGDPGSYRTTITF